MDAVEGTLDIMPRLEWFMGCLGRAFDGTGTTLEAVMRKVRFWERDIRSLIDQGLLKKDETGGRSTSYSLALE